MTKQERLERNKSVCQDYKDGLNTVQLAEKYSCSRQNIMYILTKYNVPRRTRSQAKKKWTVNEDYFEVIDSDIKGYILGFIVADGCIETCKGEDRLSFCISHKDRLLLEKIKSELDFSGYIYDIKPTKSTPKGFVSLKITSQKLCDDLVKLGVTPRKSFTATYPNIDTTYDKSFIRGYLDGDGWVSKVVGFVSGSEDLIKSVESKLNLQANTTVRPIYNKDNHYLLHYGASEDKAKIKSYLYDSSTFHLQRKYSRL